MGLQLKDVALWPVSKVELHMWRITAKEREQIFHVRIEIANTKFDLFKRALVTYHSAPFFKNFCWNVNQGGNLIYTTGERRAGGGGGWGMVENMLTAFL